MKKGKTMKMIMIVNRFMTNSKIFPGCLVGLKE